MPILYDAHMHSSFSTDSHSSMEEMVKKASFSVLDGICFTEHMDLDYPPHYHPQKEPTFVADPNDVLSEICRLRSLLEMSGVPEKERSQPLRIGFGLEFGMQSHLHDRFRRIAETYPLDLIIASQHMTYSLDPYYPETWTGHDSDAFIERYYTEMLDNIQRLPEWDTLAHLDYIIRYIPGRGDLVYDSMEKHRDLIDEILRFVIDKKKCLEVNTAGIKYGLGQPHPAPSILKRYRELGGSRITIGSDAHAPEHIGHGFAETEELLRSLGFTTYTIFRQREAVDLPL